VTLNVGDLAGQTQILLNDSGALKGAQYKVNFATFPPVRRPSRPSKAARSTSR